MYYNYCPLCPVSVLKFLLVYDTDVCELCEVLIPMPSSLFKAGAVILGADNVSLVMAKRTLLEW